MTNPPELCFCAKCGAKPGEPCRTTGGNRTTFHKARFDGETSPGQRRKATRLECWRKGFTGGAGGMPTAQAQELAEVYLAPEDFTEGWMKGRAVHDREMEKARAKYMGAE